MKYLKPLSLFQDLVKTRTLEKGRLLGLGVGDKYAGLAVSDDKNKIAAPLSVLVRTKTNIDLMVSDFQCLTSELSLVGFIVGLPFDRQRSTPDSVQIKVFIDDLRKTGNLGGGYLNYVINLKNCCVFRMKVILDDYEVHLIRSKGIKLEELFEGFPDFIK